MFITHFSMRRRNEPSLDGERASVVSVDHIFTGIPGLPAGDRLFPGQESHLWEFIPQLKRNCFIAGKLTIK